MYLQVSRLNKAFQKSTKISFSTANAIKWCYFVKTLCNNGDLFERKLDLVFRLWLLHYIGEQYVVFVFQEEPVEAINGMDSRV